LQKQDEKIIGSLIWQTKKEINKPVCCHFLMPDYLVMVEEAAAVLVLPLSSLASFSEEQEIE
jgi:hypothetical protein